MVRVGVDAADIARFAHWVGYTEKRLLRIFSKDEIDYCLSNPAQSAERFAARFAAKEACYKALVGLLREPLPFMVVAPLCTISSGPRGEPLLHINGEKLGITPHEAQASLTHTETTAIAVVILESK